MAKVRDLLPWDKEGKVWLKDDKGRETYIDEPQLTPKAQKFLNLDLPDNLSDTTRQKLSGMVVSYLPKFTTAAKQIRHAGESAAQASGGAPVGSVEPQTPAQRTLSAIGQFGFGVAEHRPSASFKQAGVEPSPYPEPKDWVEHTARYIGGLAIPVSAGIALGPAGSFAALGLPAALEEGNIQQRLIRGVTMGTFGAVAHGLTGKFVEAPLKAAEEALRGKAAAGAAAIAQGAVARGAAPGIAENVGAQTAARALARETAKISLSRQAGGAAIGAATFTLGATPVEQAAYWATGQPHHFPSPEEYARNFGVFGATEIGTRLLFGGRGIARDVRAAIGKETLGELPTEPQLPPLNLSGEHMAQVQSIGQTLKERYANFSDPAVNSGRNPYDSYLDRIRAAMPQNPTADEVQRIAFRAFGEVNGMMAVHENMNTPAFPDKMPERIQREYLVQGQRATQELRNIVGQLQLQLKAGIPLKSGPFDIENGVIINAQVFPWSDSQVRLTVVDTVNNKVVPVKFDNLREFRNALSEGARERLAIFQGAQYGPPNVTSSGKIRGLLGAGAEPNAPAVAGAPGGPLTSGGAPIAVPGMKPVGGEAGEGLSFANFSIMGMRPGNNRQLHQEPDVSPNLTPLVRLYTNSSTHEKGTSQLMGMFFNKQKDGTFTTRKTEVPSAMIDLRRVLNSKLVSGEGLTAKEHGLLQAINTIFAHNAQAGHGWKGVRSYFTDPVVDANGFLVSRQNGTDFSKSETVLGLGPIFSQHLDAIARAMAYSDSIRNRNSTDINMNSEYLRAIFGGFAQSDNAHATYFSGTDVGFPGKDPITTNPWVTLQINLAEQGRMSVSDPKMALWWLANSYAGTISHEAVHAKYKDHTSERFGTEQTAVFEHTAKERHLMAKDVYDLLSKDDYLLFKKLIQEEGALYGSNIENTFKRFGWTDADNFKASDAGKGPIAVTGGIGAVSGGVGAKPGGTGEAGGVGGAGAAGPVAPTGGGAKTSPTVTIGGRTAGVGDKIKIPSGVAPFSKDQTVVIEKIRPSYSGEGFMVSGKFSDGSSWSIHSDDAGKLGVYIVLEKPHVIGGVEVSVGDRIFIPESGEVGAVSGIIDYIKGDVIGFESDKGGSAEFNISEAEKLGVYIVKAGGSASAMGAHDAAKTFITDAPILKHGAPEKKAIRDNALELAKAVGNRPEGVGLIKEQRNLIAGEKKDTGISTTSTGDAGAGRSMFGDGPIGRAFGDAIIRNTPNVQARLIRDFGKKGNSLDIVDNAGNIVMRTKVDETDFSDPYTEFASYRALARFGIGGAHVILPPKVRQRAYAAKAQESNLHGGLLRQFHEIVGDEGLNQLRPYGKVDFAMFDLMNGHASNIRTEGGTVKFTGHEGAEHSMPKSLYDKVPQIRELFDAMWKMAVGEAKRRGVKPPRYIKEYISHITMGESAEQFREHMEFLSDGPLRDEQISDLRNRFYEQRTNAEDYNRSFFDAFNAYTTAFTRKYSWDAVLDDIVAFGKSEKAFTPAGKERWDAMKLWTQGHLLKKKSAAENTMDVGLRKMFFTRFGSGVREINKAQATEWLGRDAKEKLTVQQEKGSGLRKNQVVHWASGDDVKTILANRALVGGGLVENVDIPFNPDLKYGIIFNRDAAMRSGYMRHGPGETTALGQKYGFKASPGSTLSTDHIESFVVRKRDDAIKLRNFIKAKHPVLKNLKIRVVGEPGYTKQGAATPLQLEKRATAYYYIEPSRNAKVDIPGVRFLGKTKSGGKIYISSGPSVYGHELPVARKWVEFVSKANKELELRTSEFKDSTEEAVRRAIVHQQEMTKLAKDPTSVLVGWWTNRQMKALLGYNVRSALVNSTQAFMHTLPEFGVVPYVQGLGGYLKSRAAKLVRWQIDSLERMKYLTKAQADVRRKAVPILVEELLAEAAGSKPGEVKILQEKLKRIEYGYHEAYKSIAEVVQPLGIYGLAESLNRGIDANVIWANGKRLGLSDDGISQAYMASAEAKVSAVMDMVGKIQDKKSLMSYLAVQPAVTQFHYDMMGQPAYMAGSLGRMFFQLTNFATNYLIHQELRPAEGVLRSGIAAYNRAKGNIQPAMDLDYRVPRGKVEKFLAEGGATYEQRHAAAVFGRRLLISGALLALAEQTKLNFMVLGTPLPTLILLRTLKFFFPNNEDFKRWYQYGETGAVVGASRGLGFVGPTVSLLYDVDPRTTDFARFTLNLVRRMIVPFDVEVRRVIRENPEWVRDNAPWMNDAFDIRSKLPNLTAAEKVKHHVGLMPPDEESRKTRNVHLSNRNKTRKIGPWPTVE